MKHLGISVLSLLLLLMLFSCAASEHMGGEGASASDPSFVTDPPIAYGSDETTVLQVPNSESTAPKDSETVPHTEETTAAETTEGIPQAETSPSGPASGEAYNITGSYAVRSESIFPVTVRIGNACHTERLRVAVIDREGTGRATYMDVLNVKGEILCSKLIGGYATVYVKETGDQALSITVFQCAFRLLEGTDVPRLTLAVHLMDLSDTLYDVQGTMTGEIGFRNYQTLKNIGGTYAYEAQGMLGEKAMLTNVSFTLAEYTEGYALVLDSFLEIAYTGLPTETVDPETMKKSVSADSVEAAYRRWAVEMGFGG